MAKYVVYWTIGENSDAEYFDDYDEAEHYLCNMQITAGVFEEECQAAGNDPQETIVEMEEVEEDNG